ncbi:zinc finger protein 184 [Eurytemora carolleeae]|uniref:zinc finger protein 184 n=1 Tax=Eurytemora carolleeae TaxID=1294199 RepID=UPI000C76CFA5|nr:zinc finger protein 184 [Eurytemora carolleeae]|eukprot:XP_023334135.1 zinc finger protein 184-like [Eurytemora affinis]
MSLQDYMRIRTTRKPYSLQYLIQVYGTSSLYQDTTLHCKHGLSLTLPKLIVGLIFPALETSLQFQQSLDNFVLLPDYTLAQVRHLVFGEEKQEVLDQEDQDILVEEQDMEEEENEEEEEELEDPLQTEDVNFLLSKTENNSSEHLTERYTRKAYKGEIYPGEYPYKCTLCHKKFKQVGHLNHHERSHTGNRKYPCDVCHRRFLQKCHLIDHMRIHSGEKPFACNDCGRSFTFSSGLKSHQRTHSAEKLYQCGICEKTFNQKQNLKTHERLHTGDLKFMCEECGKCFNTKSNLSRHICRSTKDRREIDERSTRDRQIKPTFISNWPTDLMLT